MKAKIFPLAAILLASIFINCGLVAVIAIDEMGRDSLGQPRRATKKPEMSRGAIVALYVIAFVVIGVSFGPGIREEYRYIREYRKRNRRRP